MKALSPERIANRAKGLVRRLLSAAGISLLALAPLAVRAQTVEVNQNDPMATYKTINAALAVVAPGTTILVHPGTYSERVTLSGVTLKALRGPEVTVIQSPDGTGDGVTMTGTANVTLIGFRVQGHVNGIVINASGMPIVRNCVISGNTAAGILIASAVNINLRIENNTAANNSASGISSQYGGNITYSGVIGNISYKNGAYGFLGGYNYGYCYFGDYNCAFGNTSGATGNAIIGSNGITADPLLNPAKQYRFTSSSSPAVNAGNLSSVYNDPDGTRNDMGAYGGPFAANWWRDPFSGPTISNVTIDPPQVAPGGTITIRATAKTE
ncbi:MAG: right-handed parallel beta-helix repeat-containing protein [Candidatus Sumerlaeota bacterium]|nr:right-handed parallel beta-helix repeat-containing protein [Candidatus Sumerlaeota bacterium]